MDRTLVILREFQFFIVLPNLIRPYGEKIRNKQTIVRMLTVNMMNQPRLWKSRFTNCEANNNRPFVSKIPQIAIVPGMISARMGAKLFFIDYLLAVMVSVKVK